MIPGADDLIGTLLRLTGPRPAAPPERAARVKAAVHAEWRAAVAARARRRTQRLLAVLAAAAVLAVTIPLLRGRLGAPAPVPAAARIEIDLPGAAAGGVVPIGGMLDTGAGRRMAIRMSSGHSVRLDTGTRARVESGAAVTLLAGGLYVDSGGPERRGRGPIEIRTPAGPVQDLGTQFEVRVLDEDGAVRVRVREGLVALRRPAGSSRVMAGRELLVDAGGASRERPLDDPAGAWGWIGEVTPMMAIDGRTLGEFLAWFGRERGVAIRFADPDLEASAAGIRLSGSIDGMSLDEALASVLAISGLGQRSDGALLFIERPPGAQ
jgi:hypothetical protein